MRNKVFLSIALFTSVSLSSQMRGIVRSLLFFYCILSVSTKAISQTTNSQHFEFQNDGSLVGKWFKILTVNGGGIFNSVGFSGEILTFDDVAPAQKMDVLASVHDKQARVPGANSNQNIFHSSNKPPLQNLRWVQTANTGTYTGTLELWGRLNFDWQNSGVWINWKYINDGAYTITWENGSKDAVSTAPIGNGTYWDFVVGQVFNDNGNVGVGTISPNSKLTIYGTLAESWSSGLSIRREDGSDFRINTMGHSVLFKNMGGSQYQFRDNQDNAQMIIEGGGIGIGSAPQNGYKLAVKGDVLCTKVKVISISNFPDYVFHSSYRLRPLSEVEQYIQQHHHLPEVPSAAEVEKNGLDLGDNQATLLKKIEELTLYLIEIKKENTTLKKRIEKLENKK